jgi:hypothetical protein
LSWVTTAACGADAQCVEGACCDTSQVCAGTCCESQQTCVSGACCPIAKACGMLCCGDEGICVGGNTCCAATKTCGSACCGASELCVDGGTNPTCATLASGTTVLYATASSYDGALGSRSGADAACAAHKPAKLTCSTLHAFISVGTPTSGSSVCGAEDDELRDMPSNYGYDAGKPLYFFHSGDGRLRKFASSWSDALDSGPGTLIDITVADGTGSFPGMAAFWTGSYNNGAVAQDCGGDWNYSCLGWTTTASAAVTRALGTVGDADTTDAWIHATYNYTQCHNKYPMLCACGL